MKSKNQLRRERKKQKRQADQERQESLAEQEHADEKPATETPVEEEPVEKKPDEKIAGLESADHEPVDHESADRELVEPTEANSEDASVAETTELEKTKLPGKNSITMLARKYNWINENDPMYEMYNHISSRFKRSRSEAEEEESDRNGDETHESELDNERPAISKKQLRKAAKPSLAELKAEVRHPELIEWFDADAPHPHFLARMKTLPHVVQVPSNWRQRSEIPQFGTKPIYELPQNIVETNIRDAWKGERLDVDYDRMYSAFFASEYERALLPYGQIVDLKLRRAFKPPAKKQQREVTKPQNVSKRLRKALGINESDALPWEEAVRRMGPAPGYAQASSVEHASKRRWGMLE